jgi:hypothetical protein
MKMLEHQGLIAELEPAWSALPTVTATAKPAWAPMTTKASGASIGEGFEPSAANGKPLRAPDFRAALEQLGWKCIKQQETGDPATSAWTEIGAFDNYGHEQQAKLAWRIDEELRSVCHRVRELFGAGWSHIQVITDHGWLWMPGNLPKVDLPKHLTLSRWGRCALTQPGANHQLPQVGWFWANEHPVVLAPGISVFQNGTEYTHGGLTLQECFTPILKLSQGTAGQGGGPVSIEKIRWVNLRLNVQITGNREGLMVDLRQRPADASSTLVAQPKAPDENGGASLLVSQDELMGQAAVVVVLQGEIVLAKELTTIGEN